MFSIPAVKGISFGEGFGFAHLYGSQANDPIIIQDGHSVNYQTKEDVILEIKGRHDPAIIHRARAVVDALSAFGVLDFWMSHQSTTYFEA